MTKISFGGLFSLLGQQDDLNVGQDTFFGNVDTGQEFVQLFIVTNGKLKVTWDINLVKFKNDQDILQKIKLWGGIFSLGQWCTGQEFVQLFIVTNGKLKVTGI